VLGVIFALLSAGTFAFNNAAMRRGVVTGTPIQGMALTVPIGVACFLVVAVVTGQIFHVTAFPLAAAAWMAGVGLVHFIFGRYCNYRANREAGVNLTAPVIQLQVVVTLVLAVIILREPCTVLQAIGGLMIVAGSFITQRQPMRAKPANGTAAAKSVAPVFVPHYFLGTMFAIGAALGYGTSPILARFALADTGAISSVLGGLIAYCAATAFVAVAMLWPAVRNNVMSLSRENMPWFIASGVFVAMAQGFFYAAVAVAPIMLVMPILQFSLVFRLIFAMWLTPEHEVFGWLVILGVVVSITGSLTVAVDTDVILQALAIPDGPAALLRQRIG
jgi:drug/metabolite transporter (DMT)-like permease